MIIKQIELYTRTAKANNLPPELISSVAEAVLGELVECVTDPKELAYELDHVGTFHLRHQFFLKKLARARRFNTEEFLQKHTHLEGMIASFKAKKVAFRQMKDEYKKDKALQQG